MSTKFEGTVTQHSLRLEDGRIAVRVNPAKPAGARSGSTCRSTKPARSRWAPSSASRLRGRANELRGAPHGPRRADPEGVGPQAGHDLAPIGELRHAMRNGYFTWIKQVRELLGKTSGPDDGEDFLAMVNDVSWFGCYDDGMTAKEAVAEFNRKTKN